LCLCGKNKNAKTDQMINKIIHIVCILLTVYCLSGCEKEIDINVDPSDPVLVVEASINQFSATLNYVFITTSIDYFKPDLTLGGIKGAQVYIIEGIINGSDTSFPAYNRFRMFGLGETPFIDSLIPPIGGVYYNPYFLGKENTSYKLEITLADGRRVEGRTHIPKVISITKTYYEFKGAPDGEGRRDAYFSFDFTDPMEQNNYRLALKRGGDSLAIGWGNADSYRTFDDELANGANRTYPFLSPFKEGDTLNLYFSSIGRTEFLFWQSFGSASNSGNPFSTPAVLKSNITGATGTFTGYGVSFKQVIFK
jgi:hypothetical protein